MNNDQPSFNYIITIHNKQDLIREVLIGVLMCCRSNSHIYAVLDACTDHTEAVIDEFISRYKNIPLTKIYENDVHELLTINAGLRVAQQIGIGYNIILQDDVILADFELESKISNLYARHGGTLGYVSLRLGANLSPDILTTEEIVPFCSFIENAYGHGLPEAEMLPPDCFVFRDIPIKSPVCIPFEVVRTIGLLEEKLAPYAHDDTDYAIRCLNSGFRNGVYSLRFYSEVKWGGTRVNPHPQISKIQKRNIGYIKVWHYDNIIKILNTSKMNEVDYSLSNRDTNENILAEATWNNSRLLLNESDNGNKNIFKTIAYRIRNLWT